MTVLTPEKDETGRRPSPPSSRKLYGRDPELSLLLDAVERTATTGRQALVLVSGAPGGGKSALVNELRHSLESRPVLFASGKFDQYKRDIPYATFAQALQSAVREIVVRGDDEVRACRSSLQQALGSNGRLITSLVPELELIVGSQPVVVDLPHAEAKNRFKTVFCRLLGALASPERAVVLFLDDLQWLDAATLELLEHVFVHVRIDHMLVVGAYRDSEAGDADPFRESLERIKASGACLHEVHVSPLNTRDLGRLLADSFEGDVEHVTQLAELVHEKTHGNPLFSIQLASELSDRYCARFDRTPRSWAWDLHGARERTLKETLAEIMIGRFRRLSPAAQHAMNELACLGNSASLRVLGAVHGSEASIERALSEAVAIGFVNETAGAYSFTHDRIQEATYARIPELDRALMHLEIGRALLTQLSLDEQNELVFDLVSQFNRAATLLTSPDERKVVATLNRAAGERARRAAAFVTALGYFARGSDLLPLDAWQDCHELVFGLELARAECEYLSGEQRATEERFEALWQRARDLTELAKVVNARSIFYTTTDRHQLALPACLEYLERVDVKWSAHPSNEDVERECACLFAELGSRSIEALLNLPPMADPDCSATTSVLASLFVPAYASDRNLLELCVLRLTRLSLQSGNADGSAFAYALLAMFLGPRFGRYEDGYRFGTVGLRLTEKRTLNSLSCSAFMAFGAFALPWLHHLRESHAICQRAFEMSLEAGNHVGAAHVAQQLVKGDLALGAPLGGVNADALKFLAFARDAGYVAVCQYLRTQLALVRTLRGLTPRFGFFDDEDLDERSYEDELGRRSIFDHVAAWYWVRKTQARFHAGEIADALHAAAKAQELIWVTVQSFEEAEMRFYVALTHAAAWETSPAELREQHLTAAIEHHDALVRRAQFCPANFGCRVATVAAEIARMEGKQLLAEQLYEKAIDSADEEGFVQVGAIAHELAARFYRERGLETISFAHLCEAHQGYSRWGALGKVKQLEQQHPSLDASVVYSFTEDPGGPLAGVLDVAALIKTSQALTGDIVLDELLGTLLSAAIEHAQARRGVLLTPRGEELRVEADATLTGNGLVMRGGQDPTSSADLPQSIVHFVAHTRQTVLLDAASIPQAFSTDSYLTRIRVRSLLCLPLVKRDKLIGVLYLENALTPRAFTPARTAMVLMLASQAAICLENARLYAELNDAGRRLARIIDTMPSLLWSSRPDGYVEFANRQWLEYTGLSLDEARGWGWTRVIHDEDLQPLLKKWQGIMTSGSAGEVEARLRRADGSYRWFLLRAQPLLDRNANVAAWYGANIDFDDRKRAQLELDAQIRFWTLRSEISASFASAARDQLDERVRDALCEVGELFDVEGIAIYWFGEPTPAQASATHAWVRRGVLPLPKVVSLSSFSSTLAALRRGDVVRTPRVQEKPDRGPREALQAMGVRAAVSLPMVVGGETVGSINLTCHSREAEWSDHAVQQMQLLTEVFANALARRRALVHLERSATALTQAQKRLAHGTRASALGELAASIARQVEAPLAAILAEATSCLDSLGSNGPNFSQLVDSLTKITNDGARAGQVATRIRALVSRTPVDIEACDISAVVAAVLPLLTDQLSRDDIRLETSLAKHLPRVMADPLQLQQVVLNLVINAAESLRDVEHARRKVLVRSLVERRGSVEAVVVEVEDRGVGFGSTNPRQLFETFYTTKPDGLGMGLSISRSIIERYGGRLSAQTNVSHGATFRFALEAIP